MRSARSVKKFRDFATERAADSDKSFGQTSGGPEHQQIQERQSCGGGPTLGRRGSRPQHQRRPTGGASGKKQNSANSDIFFQEINDGLQTQASILSLNNFMTAHPNIADNSNSSQGLLSGMARQKRRDMDGANYGAGGPPMHLRGRGGDGRRARGRQHHSDSPSSSSDRDSSDQFEGHSDSYGSSGNRGFRLGQNTNAQQRTNNGGSRGQQNNSSQPYGSQSYGGDHPYSKDSYGLQGPAGMSGGPSAGYGMGAAQGYLGGRGPAGTGCQ